MYIAVVLSIFIQWPFLALVPAAIFAAAFFRCRRPMTLVAALAWLVYVPYEWAMKLRILCSGECNIRVDLLLLYPVLFTLSAIGVYAIIMAIRELMTGRGDR